MKSPRRPHHARSRETGAVTILVSLALLVLLTLSALAMSRNSLREVFISGTAREGGLVRNAADSGIEWSVFWMDPANESGATSAAASLNTLMTTLLKDNTLSGVPYDPQTQAVYDIANPPAPCSDLTFSGTAAGVSVALTRMGKLPISDTSQSAGSGFTPAAGTETLAAPDLWAVRSDAQYTIGTGASALVFRHAKEAWVSTPVR
jgi:hypothetical protein